MNMKKLLLALAAVAVMSSACQKAEVEAPVNEGRVLDATIENIAVTRTVMDEDNNIRWSDGDQIVGFMKSTFGAKFQVTGSSVGKTSASFEEVSSDGLNAGTELDHIIAYYPYSSSVKIAKSGSNYALDVVLPAEQTYVQESFGNGAMPMVAVSETNNITFRNVCGGMKLQLKGTQKVASVKVEGKNGEILSGAAVVIAYTDGTKPSITMSDETSTSVTLNCGSGVQLNENDAVEFIIVLPPVAFSKGFVVTVADAAGNVQTIETDKVNEVKRSALLVMPAVTLEDSGRVPQEGDYIDEYGINHGQGIEIDGVVWAPVNCGYHAEDFKYGKLYQWGRKYGQGYDGMFCDINGAESDEYYDSVVPAIEDGGISVINGNQKENSNVFYTVTEEFKYDWASISDGELWNSGTESNPIKTEYDPCPVGWRVPTYDELNKLGRNKSLWTTDESGQVGYWFCGSSTYSDNVLQVFLPAAGYRFNSGDAYYRGGYGNYWSSRPCSSSFDYAYDFCFYNEEAFMSGTSRANGFSVRCVQESAENADLMMYRGYMDSDLVNEFSLNSDGVANIYTKVTPEVLNRGIERGIIIKEELESRDKTAFPDTPKGVVLIFAIPHSSTMNVYKDDGIGNPITFDHDQLNVNGETVIVINSEAYRLYGEYQSIDIINESASYYIK